MDTDLTTLGPLAGVITTALVVLVGVLRKALRPDRVSYHLEIHRDGPLDAPEPADTVSRL